MHEGGFRIEKDYRDRWFFRRPDGRAVPACGYRPEDMTDDDVDTADEYFQTHTSAEGFTRPSAEVSWANFKKARPGSRPAIAADQNGQ